MANLLLAVIYLAFISLGLPDALLGSAWPTMHQEFGAPISWQGGIAMIISAGTIISALLSDRLTLRFGAGRVTAVSVAMTALGLSGFSMATNYWMLLLIAIPYGLGAGGVDAALNNYVAIHYESRHMSWLHCMWGIGASVGPYIMGFALGAGQGWPWGYRYVAIVQVVITLLLFLSLPLWKGRTGTPSADAGVPSAAGNGSPSAAASGSSAGMNGSSAGAGDSPSPVASGDASSPGVQGDSPSPVAPGGSSSPVVQGSSSSPVILSEASAESKDLPAARKPLGIRGVLAIRGAKEILIMFFCYCAVECTCFLWTSTYLNLGRGFDTVSAASWSAVFYLGITIGRALSGFMTMRFDDPTMIRIGQALLLAGLVVVLLPLPGAMPPLVGLGLMGLGCAPIYPCIIHSTPGYFGEENSQAIVGVQMACAYTGALLAPPLFGLIAQYVSIDLFPWYGLIILALMFLMHERLRKLRG